MIAHSPSNRSSGTALSSLDGLVLAREKFREHGVSVACWARERGFSTALVYSVLSGKNQATRGESFKIGVALGLRKPPSGDFFNSASSAPSTRMCAGAKE